MPLLSGVSLLVMCDIHWYQHEALRRVCNACACNWKVHLVLEIDLLVSFRYTAVT